MKLRAQWRVLAGAMFALATGAFAAPAVVVAPVVHKLGEPRVSAQGGMTRITFSTEGETQFATGELHHPERVYFDLQNTVPASAKPHTMNLAGIVDKVRVALTRHATTRVVVDLVEAADVKTLQTANPSRFVIEVRRLGSPRPKAEEPKAPQEDSEPQQVTAGRSTGPKVALKKFVMPPPRPLPQTPVIAPPRIEISKVSREALLARMVPPKPFTMPTVLPPARSRKNAAVAAARASAPVRQNKRQELAKAESPKALLDDKADERTDADSAAEPARGAQTLTRALGLKLRRVVLDAGHGGRDVGTISPHGYYEKDLVLDVTHRLGKLIEERLSSEVVYTRSDDSYVGLQERTVIANREKADLFLSIHANSSSAESVAGFETFYLNLSATKRDMDVAARENAASDKTIADLTDLVKQIALHEKLDESRQFASHVHDATYSLSVKMNGKMYDRGIKRAPFMVLVGARMPSVLVEIGFLTNSNEETQLRKPEYRQKIAEALFKGISGYADTLSHFTAETSVNAALDAGN